jgi:hypothetical protein
LGCTSGADMLAMFIFFPWFVKVRAEGVVFPDLSQFQPLDTAPEFKVDANFSMVGLLRVRLE